MKFDEDLRQARWHARRARWEGGRGFPRHGQWGTGLLLIAVGFLYLLSNLGVLRQIHFRDLWPLFLMFWGASDLARWRAGHFPFFGITLTGLGLMLLLRNFGIIGGDVWGYFWPLLLILIGGRMLVARPRWDGHKTGTSNDRVNEWVMFGSVNRKVESQAFTGGEAFAMFGGVELDLRGAAIQGGEAVLEATAMFGGVEIKVPETWEVSVTGTGLFGAFEDETHSKPQPGEQRPKLVVTGQATFGGVTVKN
jgi:predicted membrane protein